MSAHTNTGGGDAGGGGLAAGEQKGLVKSLKAQVKELQAEPSP